ncbi:hypothetical protein NDU88_005375 [Pleurodeles waltl]|uniref:Uncharacterized protein n=1 Tax=Pleurodeles waltl TaxID=8319 RepID=A0AAV7X0H3_PLEWA|nr:hypothetical protein NDU88_005375 [Pleurodeles waltl]
MYFSTAPRSHLISGSQSGGRYVVRPVPCHTAATNTMAVRRCDQDVRSTICSQGSGRTNTVPQYAMNAVGRLSRRTRTAAVHHGAQRWAPRAAAISPPRGPRSSAPRQQELWGAARPPARPNSPWASLIQRRALEGLRVEPAIGPGQHTHQPRPRASAQQAADSSTAWEATAVS